MAEKRSTIKRGNDRINELPDSILGQILSCLRAEKAVATSILSKRWKNLVDFAVKLDIDNSIAWNNDQDKEELAFKYFVDKLLINRTLSLDTLILKCSRCAIRGDSDIISWVRAALRLKVKLLNLDIHMYDSSSLLPSLYGCTTLLSLELSLHKIIYGRKDNNSHGKLCLPHDFSLPSLKSLTIHKVYFDAQKINILMDGCPALEELCVRECLFLGELDNTICIRSHHLKRLNIQGCSASFCIELDVPNLRVLSYENYFRVHVVSDFKFLESAQIGLLNLIPSGLLLNLVASGLARLTSACSGVTRLCLHVHDHEACISMDLPTFQNLTWLKLGRPFKQLGQDTLLSLLYSAPNLEKLVIEEGYTHRRHDYDGRFPTLPHCLGLHLKEIDYLEFNGAESDFELIDYLLENGKVLKKLKLHCVSIKNSCFLDRLHKLSTKPTVFITFSCWKDEELMKCRNSHVIV